MMQGSVHLFLAIFGLIYGVGGGANSREFTAERSEVGLWDIPVCTALDTKLNKLL